MVKLTKMHKSQPAVLVKQLQRAPTHKKWNANCSLDFCQTMIRYRWTSNYAPIFASTTVFSYKESCFSVPIAISKCGLVFKCLMSNPISRQRRMAHFKMMQEEYSAKIPNRYSVSSMVCMLEYMLSRVSFALLLTYNLSE